MKRVVLLALLIVLSILGLPREARAAESYYNCAGFITSLPAVITTPGIWCLNQDLSTSISDGVAIQISSNNVVIDCNDFSIDGSAGGATSIAYGIIADGQLDVTVRHCNIRGFFTGVALVGGIWASGNGGNFLAEDNRLDNMAHIGIHVSGDGSVVRRNQIFNTGGPPVRAYTIDAYGIIAEGSVDILDNTVSGVEPPDPSLPMNYGIVSESSNGGNISRNVIRDVRSSPGSYAIYAAEAEMVNITENQIFGDGAANAGGVGCHNQQNNRAKDNTISGFSTGLEGCSDDGGNVVNP